MKASNQVENFVLTKNSESSQIHYRRTLELFLDYCYEMGFGFRNDLDFSKLIPIFTNDDVILYYAPVDHLLIEDFLVFRRWAGDTQYVLATHYQYLKGFFQYLVDHNHFNYNPVGLIQPISKPVPKETTYLNKEECVLLLAAAANSEFPERNFALVKLMIATGLRPRELRELQLGDLDFVRKCIYIGRWKKTGKIRTVPLYDQVYVDITNYLNHEERKNKDSKQLFLNDDEPLSQKEMLRIIHVLCQDAGITKPFTPKGFRHTMATVLFINGLDLWYIKELLGHKKVITTMVYTHGWTSIPKDPHLTPNADLLSSFIQKNFRKLENPY